MADRPIVHPPYRTTGLDPAAPNAVTRIVRVVGVAYGCDVDQASAIMTGIAEANEHVLDEPPPVVTFDTFGDNALTLTLRAFVASVDVRIGTISALNRAINAAFADAGINIAFPQRDLHLDTTRPLQIQLRRSATTSGARGSQGDPTE
jgi:potassium efflux system protein